MKKHVPVQKHWTAEVVDFFEKEQLLLLQSGDIQCMIPCEDALVQGTNVKIITYLVYGSSRNDCKWQDALVIVDDKNSSLNGKYLYDIRSQFKIVHKPRGKNNNN